MFCIFVGLFGKIIFFLGLVSRALLFLWIRVRRILGSEQGFGYVPVLAPPVPPEKAQRAKHPEAGLF